MENPLVDNEFEGSIGFFWPFNGKLPNLQASEPERGYVHRDGGWLIIETLDEDVARKFSVRQAEGSPLGIAALLPEKSVLFLENIRSGWIQRSGYRASSRRCRARTAISNIPFDRLLSSKVKALSANFHGVGDWAGLSATKESRDQDEHGRIQSWTVTLKSANAISHPLRQGRSLMISTTWKVGGDEDRRVLSAPVTIGCSSLRPRDVWDLLQPLLHVQGLLNLAWDGFVAADTGSAELHLKKKDGVDLSTRPEMWNGALMVPLAGVSAPKSMNENPLFSLSALGGIAGLTRWIRLCDEHPRAINPVINRYRYGPTTAETTLLDIASAIEYWVKCNRPAAWANAMYAQALAGRVGNHFTKWVGDPEKWGRDFWRTYNKLKHEITYAVDPHSVSDLAQSGRLLLAAALLDRAACSKAPSRQLFNTHRTDRLGRRLRSLYT
ncbi:ApeA N-terminal domain 1-containing protein [Sphaerisporangium aureirubrum]|uniref:HEPN domain-containing protein n=1 Tax=Sphaerisporangium aureirubrum TaxID=1544736 RepID=A0ABW1N9W1_9ACTN